MYEINLVPDVKGELLKTQKLRNLIITICLGVGIACAALLTALGMVVGAQGLALKDLDNQIACRYKGNTTDGGKCDSKYGEAVLDIENSSEFLTIQDQMTNLTTLKEQKVELSRLFKFLNAILLNNGEYQTQISELAINMTDWKLAFEVQGQAANKVHLSSVQAFRANVEHTYYDYGDYMYQTKDGSWEAIPTYCIKEKEQDGILYGLYQKGAPGCEAPFDTDEEVKEIKIRRSYFGQEDFEDYRDGKKDSKKQAGDEDVKGYYFESKCLRYHEEIEKKPEEASEADWIDEDATLEACAVLADSMEIGDARLGKNANDDPIASFSAELPIAKDPFLAKNHFLRVMSPGRQNVTDSYIQVRDLFASGNVSLDGDEDGK